MESSFVKAVPNAIVRSNKSSVSAMPAGKRLLCPHCCAVSATEQNETNEALI
jgi:RNase P subunit RPR2